MEQKKSKRIFLKTVDDRFVGIKNNIEPIMLSITKNADRAVLLSFFEDKISVFDEQLFMDLWDPYHPIPALFGPVGHPDDDNQKWRWEFWKNTNTVLIRSNHPKLKDWFLSYKNDKLVLEKNSPYPFIVSKINNTPLQIRPKGWEENEFANEYIAKKSDKTLRIMTYNVQEWKNFYFGQIPWSEKIKYYEKDKKRYESANNIMEVISSVGPDVLALQETSKSVESKKQHKILGNQYEYGLCDADGGWFHTLQNGLFVTKANKDIKPLYKNSVTISKGLAKNITDVPRCMQMQYTTVKGRKKDDGICFATLHLSYKSEQKMDNAIQAVDYLDNLKLKNIVLMGDFNSHVGSDVYNYITRFYIDSAIKNLQNRGANLDEVPYSVAGGSRIDYIFLSNTWDFENFPLQNTYVHYNYHSDHFPVIADLGVK